MTTALALNAQSTIINGHGLQESANLISAVATFQSHVPIVTMANTYAVAIASNANVDLLGSLNNLCAGVSAVQWLIDAYPSNIAPTSSGATNPYSFSTTINNQAALPFSHGLSGFANVFSTAYSYMMQGFETAASIYMLQGKTYAQSGLGYKGPVDLATNGIDNNGILLGNVVANWGTMYDINNIGTASDPYVFGQNLLNQGLGSYGNLSAKLTSVGLNTTNLSQIPQNTVTVSQVPSSVATSTPIGQVSFPTLANVTTATVVSGNSTDVILSIYQSITGADLQNILTATNVTIANTSITTLADYLNFNKITATSDYTALGSLGVTDFASFTKYLQSKIGSGYFKSWAEISTLFSSIDIPTQTYTTSSNTDPILQSSTVSTLLALTGTGSGPFNNLIITDLLGATAGMPYTTAFQILNSNYLSLNTNKLNLAVSGLNSAVLDYDALVQANVTYPDNPDITGVNANVANVNAQLNALTISNTAQTAYYQMLNQLTREVSSLTSAGVIFNSGYTSILRSFAQQITSTATDKVQYQTYQFFANIIADDAYGDTIRSAVSESINTSTLSSKGIIVKNDPQPQSAITQSKYQNISLSTYLSQNK